MEIVDKKAISLLICFMGVAFEDIYAYLNRFYSGSSGIVDIKNTFIFSWF
jgi:hypothetical protein